MATQDSELEGLQRSLNEGGGYSRVAASSDAGLFPVVLLYGMSGDGWHNRVSNVTYLVCLSDRPETGATRASSDGLSPHLVAVHFRDVVEFVLERLASSVFASARDFADTGSLVENALQILPG